MDIDASGILFPIERSHILDHARLATGLIDVEIDEGTRVAAEDHLVFHPIVPFPSVAKPAKLRLPTS